MKLIEAFDIIRKAKRPAGGAAFRLYLACGFTPLHLQTFIQAHMSINSTLTSPEISSGLYGDLWGNISRINPDELDGIAIFLEWGDLDPRLGLRGLGKWTQQSLDDIQVNVKSRCTQFLSAVQS